MYPLLLYIALLNGCVNDRGLDSIEWGVMGGILLCVGGVLLQRMGVLLPVGGVLLPINGAESVLSLESARCSQVHQTRLLKHRHCRA